MNVLFDLIALAVVALIVFIFAKRGFIKSVFRLLKWFFAFLAAYFFGGKLATFFYDKIFYRSILSSMTQRVQALYDGATAGFSGEVVYERLPFFLQTEEIREKLAAIESGEGMVNAIAETVAKPIATVISNVIGYVLVFVVAFVALLLLTLLLDKLVKLSGITKFINALLGACFGVLLGFLLLVVAVSVLRIFFANSAVYTNSFLAKWILGMDFIKNLRIFNVGERWISGIQ